MKLGHFKDGDLCGCISKSNRESSSVPEKEQIKFVHFMSLSNLNLILRIIKTLHKHDFIPKIICTSYDDNSPFKDCE